MNFSLNKLTINTFAYRPRNNSVGMSIIKITLLKLTNASDTPLNPCLVFASDIAGSMIFDQLPIKFPGKKENNTAVE
jgi:hypothetical protein